MIQNVAPEFLRDNVLKKKLGDALAEQGIVGTIDPSQLYYLGESIMKSLFLGENVPYVMVQRNDPPGDDKIGVITFGNYERPWWTFIGGGPNKSLLGVNVFATKMRAGDRFDIKVGGVNHVLEAKSKLILDSTRVSQLVQQMAKDQEKIDYDKICKDGVLRSLFAFGHGQNQEGGIDQLVSVIESEPSGWNVSKQNFEGNLKDEYLRLMSMSDYVMKGAHRAGKTAIFHMVDSGSVTIYERTLDKNTNKIYQKCPGVNELKEQVIVLRPNPAVEESDEHQVDVEASEMIKGWYGAQQTNGGQSIYFDNSCFNQRLIVDLYAENLVRLNQDLKHALLAYFVGPEDQQLQAGFGHGKTLKWMVLEGLRQGLSVEEIAAQPHNDGQNREGEAYATASGPGLGALQRQSNAFEKAKAKVSNIRDEDSQRDGLNHNVGLIIHSADDGRAVQRY